MRYGGEIAMLSRNIDATKFRIYVNDTRREMECEVFGGGELH